VATTSIDLRGLGFGYGPQPVLHDVTAAIGAGSRVAIGGPDLEAPESGSVTGGFAAYVVERERAKAAAREAFEDYDRTRQGLVDRARREKEWARQGVGRATSATARREERDKFIRAANVAGAQARGAAAAKTLRALDRLDSVDDPRDPWDLRLRLNVSSRSGDDVAGLREAAVRRAGFTLGPVDLHVARGDRIVIAGPNGAGKTTLLAALLGRVELSSGTQWTGASVVIGEIDQVRRTFNALGANVLVLDERRTTSTWPRSSRSKRRSTPTTGRYFWSATTGGCSNV